MPAVNGKHQKKAAVRSDSRFLLDTQSYRTDAISQCIRSRYWKLQ